jgi:hypothetical protein
LNDVVVSTDTAVALRIQLAHHRGEQWGAYVESDGL